MIVKEGNMYVVKSESGKEMGRYRTRREAKIRLMQIEYYKHKDKGSG